MTPSTGMPEPSNSTSSQAISPSFRGVWRVAATEAGTEIEFTAEFDLGMPTLADILDPVAESALRDNIIVTLAGLLGAVGLVEPAEHA